MKILMPRLRAGRTFNFSGGAAAILLLAALATGTANAASTTASASASASAKSGGTAKSATKAPAGAAQACAHHKNPIAKDFCELKECVRPANYNSRFCSDKRKHAETKESDLKM